MAHGLGGGRVHEVCAVLPGVRVTHVLEVAAHPEPWGEMVMGYVMVYGDNDGIEMMIELKKKVTMRLKTKIVMKLISKMWLLLLT